VYSGDSLDIDPNKWTKSQALGFAISKEVNLEILLQICWGEWDPTKFPELSSYLGSIENDTPFRFILSNTVLACFPAKWVASDGWKEKRNPDHWILEERIGYALGVGSDFSTTQPFPEVGGWIYRTKFSFADWKGNSAKEIFERHTNCPPPDTFTAFWVALKRGSVFQKIGSTFPHMNSE